MTWRLDGLATYSHLFRMHISLGDSYLHLEAHESRMTWRRILGIGKAGWEIDILLTASDCFFRLVDWQMPAQLSYTDDLRFDLLLDLLNYGMYCKHLVPNS